MRGFETPMYDSPGLVYAYQFDNLRPILLLAGEGDYNAWALIPTGKLTYEKFSLLDTKGSRIKDIQIIGRNRSEGGIDIFVASHDEGKLYKINVQKPKAKEENSEL